MTDITSGYYRDKDLLQPQHYNRTILEENESNFSDSFLSQKEYKEELKQPLVTQQAPESPSWRNLRQQVRSKSFALKESQEVTDDSRNRTYSVSKNEADEIQKLKAQIRDPNAIGTNQAIPLAAKADGWNFAQKLAESIGRKKDRRLSFVLTSDDTDSEHQFSHGQQMNEKLKRSAELADVIESHEKMEIEDEQHERDYLQEMEQNEGEVGLTKFLLQPLIKELGKTGSCNCQLVRSAGLWSHGLERTEDSIHSAYLHLIANAQDYIYIENQFFISSTAGDPVRNGIAQALVNKIKECAARNRKFRVIVMMPLLPAFEGNVSDPAASVLRVQLYWEYQTISRGINSLYNQLLNDPYITDPTEYIGFFGLRNHAQLLGTPVTEIVYIHSKCMIVDDMTVIMGSANINDRSQRGDRDSEIALVVEDNARVQGMFRGQQKSVAKFAHSLRMALFQEFTGCYSQAAFMIDVLSDEFWDRWRGLARENTRWYRKVFRCYPDDKIDRFKTMRSYEQRAQHDMYPELVRNVKGFLVEFPLYFLRYEDLRISIFNKEFLLPDENFV